VVAYDPARGEPRGRRRKGAPAAGDCVDCGLCVAVCPTGIDIRNGLQMECIGCTQCIDACNGVMEKLGRAPSLIGYRSLAALERRSTRLVRPRVVVYGCLLAAVGAAFVTALARRAPLDLQVDRNASALYQTTADGRFGNAYTLHVQNRDRRDHAYRIRLDDPERFELVAGVNPIELTAMRSVAASVFVLAAADAIPDRDVVIRFVAEELDDAGAPRRSVARAVTFVAPSRGGEVR